MFVVSYKRSANDVYRKNFDVYLSESIKWRDYFFWCYAFIVPILRRRLAVGETCDVSMSKERQQMMFFKKTSPFTCQNLLNDEIIYSDAAPLLFMSSHCFISCFFLFWLHFWVGFCLETKRGAANDVFQKKLPRLPVRIYKMTRILFLMLCPFCVVSSLSLSLCFINVCCNVLCLPAY